MMVETEAMEAVRKRLEAIIANHQRSYSPDGHEGNRLRLVDVGDLKRTLAVLPAALSSRRTRSDQAKG
jgi:hypothetical protein